MIRTCPFREFRPLAILAVGLILSALPLAARAQDWSTQERLDRLERDLNMLQRQVYRGAPTTATGGDATAAASSEIRLEHLEGQMRDLTGRVEEFTNQVSQLRQRLEQINSDNEVRTGENPPQPGVPAPGLPSQPGRYASDGAGPPARPGSVVPGPGSASTFGTLTPPGERPLIAPPQPGAAVASAGPDRGAADAASGGTPAEQYNRAFGLVKQADYANAEAALRAFIQAHPKDALVASAQYWIGETLYARKQYPDAASAFADGYKRYPKGPKAPEELLKLGMALGHSNQKQNACVAFAELDHAFPNAGPAIKKAAGEEKRRLSCG
ncbi:MAG TPA: tol-pal system protein YbgF [Stellaceae bacterium]|jgi:tol-pal system protein YbgF|nr:tol-pal system protein YbgF [Stellaceae bacterium]